MRVRCIERTATPHQTFEAGVTYESLPPAVVADLKTHRPQCFEFEDEAQEKEAAPPPENKEAKRKGVRTKGA